MELSMDFQKSYKNSFSDRHYKIQNWAEAFYFIHTFLLLVYNTSPFYELDSNK